MNSREQTMAVALIGLLLLGGGAVGGYMFVYSPLQEKKQARETLENEVSDLETKLLGAKKAAPQVAAAKRQSLPSDPVDPRDANKTPTFNTAKAQYKLLLERLLQQAGFKDYKIPGESVLVSRPPITPELAPKKPAYTAIAFRVNINKADIWQIVDFLHAYYELDLLHQITDLKISRESNKPNDPRNSLSVQLTSEALVLDGAEPRSSLFPVSSAVAAVAGWRIEPAIARNTRLTQYMTITTTENLATRSRDYTLIPQRDMFFGPLPAYKPPKPEPLTVAKIDEVTMTRDEKPQDIKVEVTGEGKDGATISASIEGSLIPEGDLKYDPKSKSVTIPAIDKEASDYLTSTVTVTAKAANGTTAKTTFRVSPEPMPKAAPKDDIAGYIKLIIVSTTNDGTARAVIKDAANPFRYIINATTKGITVGREYFVNNKKGWDEEVTYRQNNPQGLLLISDEDTATKRTFRVIAIEQNALVLAEQPAVEPTKASELPGKGFGGMGGGKDGGMGMGGKGGGKGGGKNGMGGGKDGGMGGGMGFRPPAGPRQGPAEPISAVASNLAITNLPLVYYRWDNGKSLKSLVKLTPDEVSKILRHVADGGPVVLTAVAGN